MFVKHVATNVLKNDVVVYLIGGNPSLVQMLLNWMAVTEDNQDMDSYVFPSEQLRLGTEHGSRDDTSLVINTRMCLEYLTSIVEPLEILKDPLIVESKDLWCRMGSVDVTIDLFDRSTWCNVDYEALVDFVHHLIALHPIHQQRVENHIQMAAQVASTHVEEDRQSWRAISLPKIMRPFNKEAVEDKKSKVKDPKKREKII